MIIHQVMRYIGIRCIVQEGYNREIHSTRINYIVRSYIVLLTYLFLTYLFASYGNQ